jgi:predicted  nucleic acid-binding Zn-ribbon protein
MSAREGTGRTSRPKSRPNGDGPLRRIQTRGERLLHWFPELRKSLLAEGDRGIEGILGQLESLREQVSRRAQETGREIEARAERLIADLEKQAVRGLRPLLSRADVVSRAEVESFETRIAHLEGRLGHLLDERSALTSRLHEIERQLDEVRADASERVRELTLRLAAGEELGGALPALREHLDALSKEQVTRNLDLGKLHDRLVRLEMRLGDLLREQSARLPEQEEARRRLASLRDQWEEARRVAGAAADQAAAGAATARELAGRIATLGEERAADRREMFHLAHRIGDLERAARELELRVGDLTERQVASREEAAGLAARVSQLELAAARPAPGAPASERAEGH